MIEACAAKRGLDCLQEPVYSSLSEPASVLRDGFQDRPSGKTGKKKQGILHA
jgi:hypothetical protein